MNKKRPVNLNLLTIKQPLPALASITHRITGVVLSFGLILIFWLFDLSLSSALGFNLAIALLQDNLLVQVTTWGMLVALVYHLLAGLKHLLNDLGIGEDLVLAHRLSALVFILTFIAALILGVWVW